MLILALLAAAQAAPAPSDVKAYGDWAVACDNIRFCEATSLMPGEDLSGDPPQVSITREGGPAGDVSLEITPNAEYRGAWRIEVDGKPVANGSVTGPSIVLQGAAAAELIDAMLKGQAMTTRAGDGKVLSQASLKGISASLRYFDASQGRAGARSAFVAKGPGSAAAVPGAPPVPRVQFVRPSGKPDAIPAALRTAMGKQSDCDSVYEGGEGEKPKVETHALGGGKTLALIPCGSGAYNFSTVPFIVERGKAVVARFDHVPGWTQSEGIATLVNADWDAAKAELSSYTKGRGIGDCGSSEGYVWDGAMFRLVEARAMGECRGSANWLRIWKAEPVAR
ncbi:hypothetical protein FHS95_003718 [Sphingomonas naasensis]|uniref:DUF1176 domain-containing protein n=1 Tax=Sphingomonas naasensis TaxID=1344951 RepID=A0A4S1WGT1_9SPHN|nr:DUF1176 domain-containing protein [Sphingomonas naasensis]NIJ22007.1 hypothetical protein [Sphingomonas naasensis]TGX42314.1 DUF1176 domain-containing protein [Sphingomonas naasensis]